MKKIFFTVCFLFFVGASFFIGRRWKEEEINVDRAILRGDLSRLERLLDIYFHDNGHYPSSNYQRALGEPLHSWRLLLLPYMEEHWVQRYNNYDFSKAWDHPDNLNAMEGDIPDSYLAYKSHSQFTESDQFTDYVLIKLDEKPSAEYIFSACKILSDARTILVQDKNSSIHWMSPRD